ncbi:MAG: hypothetical protein LKF96_04125 [Treponema sp.]|jgi:hypothetical protein|nr:hypothetical protein [Treponema sp.]
MTNTDPTGLLDCGIFNSNDGVDPTTETSTPSSASAGEPDSQQDQTQKNEEALRQYENKETGLLDYWSKLNYKSLFRDSLKDPKNDVADEINATKDALTDLYEENGAKGIASALLGMLSPVDVREDTFVDPATGKPITVQVVSPSVEKSKNRTDRRTGR